jgi:hypothetical protein
MVNAVLRVCDFGVLSVGVGPKIVVITARIINHPVGSQINISADGLSAGVGYGSFKGTGEVAVGIGYGGQFKNGTRFQFSAGKNSSATGAGFSMQFGEKTNPFSRLDTMDNYSY